MKIFRLTKLKITFFIVIIVASVLYYKSDYDFKISLYCNMNKQEVCENYKKESELKHIAINSLIKGLPMALFGYILTGLIQTRRKNS